MITYWLIGITVILSWYSFDKPAMLGKLLLNPYAVHHHKQYYRLVTSGFVHANFPHLLWNMFSFFFFGRVIEFYFNYIFGATGNVLFVLLYLAAIILSDLPSVIKHKNNSRYNSLGASGGVSAVIFAAILFQPLEKICLYGVLCFPGFLFGIAYLIGSYYYAKRGKDNINHMAHIYGAAVGMIFCIMVYPRVISIFIDQVKTWTLF